MRTIDADSVESILNRLKELGVPESYLSEISDYVRMHNCKHKNISEPVYYNATWTDPHPGLAQKPTCQDCGKVFRIEDVEVLPSKTVLRK